MITGRRDRFHTLRCLEGLSGFPKRSESEHDIVETGHASTSLSSSLGIIQGQRLLGVQGKVVAVIGDGSLTGGLALEALNQAGRLGSGLVVVLNDNEMSIGRNIGAISSYLTRLTATSLYQNFRRRFDSTVGRIPLVGRGINQLIYRLKKGAKALVFRETFFTEFGFDYVGPIDGHNLKLLEHTFRNVKEMEKPVVVHVATVKGKGYIPAEGDPTLYHGVSPFSIIDGKIESKGSLTFTEAFSGIIVRLADEDERIVAITAAMADGTGLRLFQALYPHRFFDVGIAEQHAVTFASGLAISGLRPVVAIYSTFMQRAVDQVIHDVALPGLPVIFAVDRAGLVGPDGETHQGVFDIPLYRSVPGLTIMAPADQNEMERMFRYALELGKPTMIRYGKCGCASVNSGLDKPIQVGRGVFVGQKQGEVLLINLGSLLPELVQAADILKEIQIKAAVYNLRFVRPLDIEYLLELLSRYEMSCLCEEGLASGGVGEQIASLLHEREVDHRFLHIGIPDCFVPQGTRSKALVRYGLDARNLAAFVEQALVSPSPLRNTVQKSPKILFF